MSQEQRQPRPPTDAQDTPAESLSGAESTFVSPGRAPVTSRSPGPAPGAPTSPAELLLSPVEPERYALAGEFAHGGLGRILRARDRKLDRPVALKELLHSDAANEARFVAEALVTARLQHPSIVPVYDAGRWPSGEPFFSMKLVSGRSLADVIAGAATLEARLALLPHVLAVAEAIAYAHSERIIHRDLKPANVLVGEFGETVVIDWGLAKDLSRDDGPAPGVEGAPTTDGNLTLAGSVMGTPAYMPPEQALGKPVDERADVYAVGAILYHLLAGTQPYDGGSSAQVLQQVVQGPPPPLAHRQKGIPEDLLTLVSKAMAREPAQRYPTARELAEDLRRFQTGRIIAAHRYTRRERLRRFVRRHRAAVAIAAVALLQLTGMAMLSVRSVLAARDVAQRKEAEALARADELTLLQARAAAEQNPNKAIEWLRSLSPGFNRWTAVRTIAANARAHGFSTVLRHGAVANDLRFLPDGQHLVTTSDDHTLRIWDLVSGEARVLSGHTDEVWHVRQLPDGRLVSTSKDGTLRVWNLATGASLVLKGHEGPVSDAAVLPDGRLLSTSFDGSIREWDVNTGAGRVIGRAEGVIFNQLLVLPDGRSVISSSASHPFARIWDVRTGAFRDLRGHQRSLQRAALSPRGDFLVTGGLDGDVRLWDLKSGTSRLLGDHLGAILMVLLSPDGKYVAASGDAPVVRLWSLETGELHTLRGHEGQVPTLAFTPDGKQLVSGSYDSTVRVWDVGTLESRVIHGPESSVLHVVVSPDGRRLAVAGGEDVVRIFELSADPGRVISGEPGLLHLALSPDGRRLATVRENGPLRLWDLATGAEHGSAGGSVTKLAFSPDGNTVAVAGAEGLALREDGGGAPRVLDPALGDSTALVFSPDGRQLATGGPDGTTRLWDVRTGAPRVLEGNVRAVLGLAFSPDGRRLAIAGKDHTVRLWDLGTGGQRVLRGHDDEVDALAFSPDGARLASGSMDHTVYLWDLEKDEGLRVVVGGGGVRQVLFSADGSTLFTASALDNEVRRWDARTGAGRGGLAGPQGDINRIARSPDGTRLAAASSDTTVRLWDLATGESRALRGHAAPVTALAFLPDGKGLVSCSDDGTVRLWPDDLPADPEALRAWLRTTDAPAARR